MAFHGTRARSPTLQRFAPTPHRAIVVEALKGSYTKEETAKISKANWERDFSQVPPVLVELVLAWTEWEQAGFKMDATAASFVNALAKVVAAMSTVEKLYATIETKGPFGGYKPVEHVDNPEGAKKKNPASGLPENIHQSREYIKDKMTRAFEASASGIEAGEEVTEVRSRKAIEKETMSQITRSDTFKGQTSQSKQMSASEERNWNVIGDHLGRATHATEDFFAHSNWIEMAIYQKRHAQVSVYNMMAPPQARYFPSDDDYQMSAKVGKYGTMGLFTGTFGALDKIHAISDKVEALVQEIKGAKLPSSLAKVQADAVSALGVVASVLSAAATGAKALASETGHSNIAKDSPPKDLDEDNLFANSLRCAKAADEILFAPLKQIMVKKEKTGLAKQIALVDQVIALPSPANPVWSYVDEGSLYWINGKPKFR